MKRISLSLLFLLLSLYCCLPTFAQLNEPGMPTWSQYDCGMYDCINLATQQMTLNIPIIHTVT
jgi:hypothetical protein